MLHYAMQWHNITLPAEYFKLIQHCEILCTPAVAVHKHRRGKRD